jgi:hypothetical protein
MLVSPVGLRPEKGCTGDAQEKLKTTDPTSRQTGCPTSTNPLLSKNIKERRTTIVRGSRWVPDTKTDWPTDGRS